MKVQVNTEKIVLARYESGLSLPEMAKKAGLSYQTVYNIENEKQRTTKASTLKKICDVLKLCVSDVVIMSPSSSK